MVVALLVAWLTVRVQRNQIQGNISNFRHQWMAELREAASELIQLMTYILNMSVKQKNFKGGEEYYKSCARAAQLKAKVELLLSRDDVRSKAIISAGSDALSSSVGAVYNTASRPVFDKILTYKNLLRQELEQAWLDTKNDLGVNRKFFFIKCMDWWRR